MAEFDEIKNADPYAFIKADDFFNYFDTNVFDTCIRQPETISFHEEDQPKIEIGGQAKEVFRRGKIFRLHEMLDDELVDQSFLLIEFIRPRVWRIRFNPAAKGQCSFKDDNSCAIVYSTMSTLIEKLDNFEQISWGVELICAPSYYILQSVMTLDNGEKRPEVQLWIQKDPFQITAIRLLGNSHPVEKLPIVSTMDEGTETHLNLQPQKGNDVAVIWKTKPKPLKYMHRGSATILSVQTPVTAHYMGFGEQGGRHLFKDKTYMNYFNFDNMMYHNVYGGGPLDDREPLYHTEPFWVEAASHSGLQSVLGTMIDNYSQTCIDVRKKHQNTLRIATRFNEFNCMIVAADKVSDLLQTYTSIVGKPSLKPRYALGYHQGCYGYDTQQMITECIDEYQKVDFPIDGIHIDVDMQKKYKTFTIDTRDGHFPKPEDMFTALREKGVKCCTNITPHINSTPDDSYSTLNQLVDNKYYITDHRSVIKGVSHPCQERYYNWNVGERAMIKPSEQRPPYDPSDDTNLSETYDTGKPFHGGVWYGGKNGTPTYYPDLNRSIVRNWWGKQYQYLFECGLEFVWQDMTSPCIAAEYGDMKSFPFRLLLNCDTGPDEVFKPKRKAIELWSLYSFNLHKATFNGLEKLHETEDSEGKHQLKWREGRRNFIIGRGSYTGSHRFAGLWTGDNSSTWNFFSISVVQVLALGMSGNAISGQDVGGFEPAPGQNDWADPQLLIRWYCAYSLLPWFRNHYTKRRNSIENPKVQRKHGKLFQEPYAFENYYKANADNFKVPREAMLFRAVLPVCRYYVRLRYSLMQLLYDAMFENAITGMPIARSMVITDDQDTTLFSENKDYTSDQYLVRNDILVAPPLRPEEEFKRHEVYLPYPDEWFPMNLRPDEEKGRALELAIDGGSYVSCECNITDEEKHVPYITPMYIREGAIIPKIRTRLSTPDWYPNGAPPPANIAPPEANPITFHVYPGKNNLYKMYLDDGISMDSEPLNRIPKVERNEGRVADNYSEVHIQQTSFIDKDKKYTRVLTVKSPWNHYDNYEKSVGLKYTAIFWHKEAVYNSKITVDLFYGEQQVVCHPEHNERARASVVTFPTNVAHDTGVTIKLTYNR
ncbi:Alpha-glucosidase 2-like protein [Cladobotryum mycophilum]|uniref:alpha-glucosidase n=1 Tax=Cladobotryum mycophilum TaxID=491253 RepID=A0ABR0SHU8_9HYPO